MAKDQAPLDASALPPAQQQSWSAFIKSMASMSGDLSSMSAPPFILSPISLTEFPAYWGEHPSQFAAISGGKTPEERSILVLKWFMGTLKGQYTTRNEKLGSEKKPLNPVLGELFLGSWPDKDGRGKQVLVTEQVSHHPPITAYYLQNKSKGVTLQGFSGQKTTFSFPNIIVKQSGHATLTIDLPGGAREEYLITLPKLRIEGIVYGAPYVELTDTSYIQSSSGFLSTIEYKGKGYISGKSHSFKSVTTGPGGKTVLTAEGEWTKVSKLHKSETVFLDASADVKEEITVAPIAEQQEYESRNLWKEVANGIRTSDFETAAQHKTRIENMQRQLRKDEAAAKTTWPLKYFDHVESDPTYAKLAPLIHDKHEPKTEDGYIIKPSVPGSGLE